MRLPFLLLAGCLLAAAACLAKPANLVFILTDNQGAWTLGCYGNPDIRTPHIDRLAAGGLRFNRALSSNPVCSPTRATEADQAARADYARGLGDLLTVLAAQTRLLQARAQQLSVQRLRLENRIDLHLALGGDFQPQPPAAPAT